MAQQQNEEFINFLNKWETEHAKYPFFIIPELDDPLTEGEFLTVTVSPHVHKRDEMLCFEESQYQKGYEVDCCLFNEQLTIDSAVTLTTALTVIQKLQGIDFEHGLAFMSQVFIMLMDYQRYKQNLPFILFGLTWGEIDEREKELKQNKKIDDLMSVPLCKLETLLTFWNRRGARLADGLVKSPNGFRGIPSYITIPPGWLKYENLELLYPDKEFPMIQMAIRYDLKSFIEQLPKKKGFAVSPYSPEEEGLHRSQDIPEEHIFQKEGEYWSLFYKGMKKPLRMRHQKGLLYISHLLHHKGEKFDVIELVHAVEGVSVDSIGKVFSEMTADQLDELVGRQSSNNSYTSGKKSIKGGYHNIKKLKIYLEQLNREIKEADKNSDIGTQQKLMQKYETTLEKIEQYGPGYNKETEKQKNYVSKYIHRALKAIGKGSEQDDHILYEHLKKHITPITFPLSYNPEQEILWKK
jgi:hypothetical protein